MFLEIICNRRQVIAPALCAAQLQEPMLKPYDVQL